MNLARTYPKSLTSLTPLTPLTPLKVLKVLKMLLVNGTREKTGEVDL